MGFRVSLVAALVIFAGCGGDNNETEAPGNGGAGAAGSSSADGGSNDVAGAGGSNFGGGAGDSESAGGSDASGAGGSDAAGAAGSSAAGAAGDGGAGGAAGSSAAGAAGDGGAGGSVDCGTPVQCAAAWEENATNRFDDLLDGDPDALKAFLSAVPKGGDLHSHVNGGVYAETLLAWALADGGCISPTTLAAKSCTASDVAVPTSGSLYDDIVRAWSMKDFVPGAETGHDHFLATFGRFAFVANSHLEDSLADLATRAASENQLYVETMFNLGTNIGDLSANVWSASHGSAALTAFDLPELHQLLLNDPSFAPELDAEVVVVEQAHSQYRTALGCSGANPPAACDVGVRFTAQVSRTGSTLPVFGQLVAAFEIAARTPYLVAVNLSGPENSTIALNRYDLHMAMLDFLHGQYSDTALSPLHITLHAGELTPALVTANDLKAHIREAVDIGHAERIGHGVDVLGEDNAATLLADLSDRGILVEVCLSSNAQTLGVSGAAHPLATYIDNQVPVALATDNQGVSRSSMAGEYLLAATDQGIGYRQLKRMARDSLEHAFLPGDSLWVSLDSVTPVADCAPTELTGIGDPPDAPCQAYLDGSERAQLQWELERRFRAFESQQ